MMVGDQLKKLREQRKTLGSAVQDFDDDDRA
jgi:hypothetical protein